MTDLSAAALGLGAGALGKLAPIRPAPLLGALGNSWVARGITANDAGAKHPVVVAAAILKDRVRLSYAALQGTSGATSTGILSLLPALIAAGPKIVWVEAFINDATSSFSLGTSISNMRTIADTLYRAGIVAIFETIPPRGDANNTTAVRNFNYTFNDALWDEYFSRSSSKPASFYVVDTASALTSRSSSVGANYAGYMDTDNVHLIDYGSWTVGALIAGVVDRIIAPASPLLALRSNLFDRTNYPTGILGNATMNGSAGTLTSGGSGSLASNFTLTRSVGSVLTGALSKIAGINGGEYQQVVLSSGGGGVVNEQLDITCSIAGLHSGDVVQAFTDVYATGCVKVTGCYVYLNGSATGLYRGMNPSGVSGDTLPANWDRMMRTWQVTVGATETLTFRISIVADCRLADTTGTIVIRSGGVKVLSAAA